MHSSDVIKLAQLGVNLEIAKDSSLHPKDVIEIVKLVTSNGHTITIRKKYHLDTLLEVAEVGGDKVTIAI